MSSSGGSDSTAATRTLGMRTETVLPWRQARAVPVQDQVAEEVPVALVFNGISHAVMMASPLHLEDFALGFALTEGLIDRPSELYDAEVVPQPEGWEVQLRIATACEVRLRERRRNLAGRTGCGLCGTESLAQVRRAQLPSVRAFELTPEAIRRALRELKAHQQLQQATGAVHAAAWFDRLGAVQLVREDVGRHNALDKLIGALARLRWPVGEGAVCVTSRASFEMVQKTAMAGVGSLVAVSAPTTLAIDTARACGLALAGFARDSEFVAYTEASAWGLGGVAAIIPTSPIDHGR